MGHAKRLRDAWDGGFCDHSKAEKEYELGAQTGDYVCLKCGKCFWGYDGWQKAKAEALSGRSRS